MAGHGKTPKLLDQESQLKDVKRQLSDHLGCLEFRMESKLSLLAEFQEFFKRRGDVEYEYARSLERLCEKFERNTKQRNLRNEVRSTFNLWSTVLAETRKMSRERASLAEVMASEMVARLDVMVKDVQVLTKRSKDLCVEIQDQFLKELRDLSEQTKVYQHSCHNTAEAYVKACKSKEKLDSIKGVSARRKKAEEKLKEKQKQYKIQRHLLLKNRNDYLLGISRCNALSTQYFNMDVMDVVEHMDFDYHDSFRRLMTAHKDCEKDTCEAIMQSGETLVEQTKTLNFENDLHYFLSEYSGPFTPPSYFQFTPFEGDEVSTFKVNAEDVFKRWSKTKSDLKEEILTLQIQREEDVKTIQHIKSVNLKKYQITSIEDALAVIEDNGDSIGPDNFKERGNASLDRGLSLSTRGGQAILLSQKGKKDTMNFTLQISQRAILRADRLAVANAQLDILERAFSDQKVPPVPVGVDAQGRTIPGEVPQLFGGEIVKYILATGCEIPLIVESCTDAIEKYGMNMEGLFRVPGPAAVLDEFRAAFEEGLDPLANFPEGKLDVAAVASTLKAYFRELNIPLFPTDKYRDFINCTRLEDLQSRLDSLSSTIYSLPPQVICVMRFLFRFLQRVSSHSSENKMGSPNLALVFGPTLTRAPDSLDPRQLHNDVPSVNILIQMCIDRNEFLFGEAEDMVTPTVTPSPDDVPLSTSPPAEPPSAPPTSSASHPDSPLTSPQTPPGELEEELPPPPYPPTRSDQVLLPPDDAPPPPRPPKPEAMSPPPPPPLGDAESLTQEPSELSSHAHQDITKGSQDPDTSSSGGTRQELSVPSGDQESSPSRGLESSTASHATSQTSGMDALDATMQEIEDSLQEMVAPREDGEDDDSSEDEDGDIEMRIGARALYDYEARSDKELTFDRGDALQVITKTPDNNWWDGFHSGRRGFIPVAYVEITELKTSPSPSPDTVSAVILSPSPTAMVPPSALAVPAPPQRKSSIPVTELESGSSKPTEVPPHQPSIEEEEEEEVRDDKPEQEAGEADLINEENAVVGVADPISPPALMVANDNTNEESSSHDVKSPTETLSPTKANFPVKSVRSLTMQFQDPEPVQQQQQQQSRVLVEPHSHGIHRRHGSDQVKATSSTSTSDSKEARSPSAGSKVSMLSSTFQNKVAPSAPPPPIRPKPPSIAHSASAPGATAGESSGVGAFPLMPHDMPGVSPLQRVAHQSQHVGQKPAILGKKPTSQAVTKPPSKGKAGGKLKKKDSLKEKSGKPAPNPKPTAGFAATPAEIQAELQARALKKKKVPTATLR